MPSRHTERTLQRLERAGKGVLAQIVADGLNRTGFEVLDAEKAHVGGVFKAKGSAANFLRRSLILRKASPRHLVVRILMREKGAKVVRDHIRGGAIEADARRLTFGDKLAVPVGVKRSARGRVAKRMRPSEVVKPGRGGFVNRSGTAILRRVGGKRSPRLKVLYALVERAHLEPRFDFFGVAARKAKRKLKDRMRRAFEKRASASRARPSGT